MSRHGSTDPSGCGHRRILERADDVEQLVGGAQSGQLVGRDLGRPRGRRPTVGGAGRSTYVTSAGTSRLGLNISVSLVSRSSGTLTTPTLTVTPPKPPVSASPRVSVLKTVVLPERASPTIATCTQ